MLAVKNSWYSDKNSGSDISRDSRDVLENMLYAYGRKDNDKDRAQFDIVPSFLLNNDCKMIYMDRWMVLTNKASS